MAHAPVSSFGRAQGAVDGTPDTVAQMPDDALYYAALGCVECGRHETGKDRTYRETTPLQERLEHGQQAKKAREDRRDLIGERKELEAFERRYGRLAGPHRPRR